LKLFEPTAIIPTKTGWVNEGRLGGDVGRRRMMRILVLIKRHIFYEDQFRIPGAIAMAQRVNSG